MPGSKASPGLAMAGRPRPIRSAFSYFPGRGFGDVVMCNHMADANGIDQAIGLGLCRKAETAAAGGCRRFRRRPRLCRPTCLPSSPAPVTASDDDDIREFLVKDGSLALRYFGQEFPLHLLGAAAPSRFGDQGEFRFAGVRSMTEVFDEQAVLQFDKLPPLPAQTSADFAGTYRSADVDGEVTIAPKGDKLLLRFPAGEAELRRGRPRPFRSAQE